MGLLRRGTSLCTSSSRGGRAGHRRRSARAHAVPSAAAAPRARGRLPLGAAGRVRAAVAVRRGRAPRRPAPARVGHGRERRRPSCQVTEVALHRAPRRDARRRGGRRPTGRSARSRTRSRPRSARPTSREGVRRERRLWAVACEADQGRASSRLTRATQPRAASRTPQIVIGATRLDPATCSRCVRLAALGCQADAASGEIAPVNRPQESRQPLPYGRCPPPASASFEKVLRVGEGRRLKRLAQQADVHRLARARLPGALRRRAARQDGRAPRSGSRTASRSTSSSSRPTRRCARRAGASRSSACSTSR